MPLWGRPMCCKLRPLFMSRSPFLGQQPMAKLYAWKTGCKWLTEPASLNSQPTHPATHPYLPTRATSHQLISSESPQYDPSTIPTLKVLPSSRLPFPWVPFHQS